MSLLLRRLRPAKTLAERIVEEAEKAWLDYYTGDLTLEEIRADKGWHTDQPDWCGEYAGLVLGRVGVVQGVRMYVTPSTRRLDDAPGAFADGKGKWDQAGAPTAKVDLPCIIRPGDVITVETSRGMPFGDHIAIVYAVQHDQIYTYEGNARGVLPDGARSVARSVVRQVRALSSVRRVYRFTSAHTSA